MTRSPRARRRRLLTIGHSYCVELNRRLPQAIAAGEDWDVTAVGPARFHGDFGWHTTSARANEPCHVVPMPVHFAARVHTMMYGRALARLLQEPWDVVHCWAEPYTASAAQLARIAPLRVPMVVATFQNIVKRYPPPFNWFEQAARHRTDGVIAFGRTAREVLDVRGWQQPARTIPPGVDTDQFRPDPERRALVREAFGWPDDVPVVGFVGRFVAEKGIERLTSALDGVDVPWRALLVGSGPLAPHVQAWSRKYEGRVKVIAAAAHADVPGYLNAMDILCAPSQTTPRWREQFGRMLIEAFASGVPVVASTSGEIPHVVGDAGVLVSEADTQGWVDAIRTLASDSDRRAALAHRGRARALSTYAWPVVARRHVEFFTELLG